MPYLTPKDRLAYRNGERSVPMQLPSRVKYVAVESPGQLGFVFTRPESAAAWHSEMPLFNIDARQPNILWLRKRRPETPPETAEEEEEEEVSEDAATLAAEVEMTAEATNGMTRGRAPEEAMARLPRPVMVAEAAAPVASFRARGSPEMPPRFQQSGPAMAPLLRQREPELVRSPVEPPSPRSIVRRRERRPSVRISDAEPDVYWPVDESDDYYGSSSRDGHSWESDDEKSGRSKSHAQETTAKALHEGYTGFKAVLNRLRKRKDLQGDSRDLHLRLDPRPASVRRETWHRDRRRRTRSTSSNDGDLNDDVNIYFYGPAEQPARHYRV